jgi:hypothetical protein
MVSAVASLLRDARAAGIEACRRSPSVADRIRERLGRRPVLEG